MLSEGKIKRDGKGEVRGRHNSEENLEQGVAGRSMKVRPRGGLRGRWNNILGWT
jgi:hypothetical protein